MVDVAVTAKAADEAGRAAAGQDARKRRQILEGARRVFLASGFDAASMSDLAQEAGVSKGTLYVYFDSKEALFRALVSEEKAAQFPKIFALDLTDPVETALRRLGRAFIRFLMSPQVVTAKRIVVAMGDRMPQLAADFYEEGPRQCTGRLAEYLSAQVAAGALVIDDVYLAAAQFIDLCQSTLVVPLMFGVQQRASDERIDAVVDAAVRVFLSAYKAPAAN
jgi:TetR/AcrR family transcriptional regulator of autoinduction and epiphytic fitness